MTLFIVAMRMTVYQCACLRVCVYVRVMCVLKKLWDGSRFVTVHVKSCRLERTRADKPMPPPSLPSRITYNHILQSTMPRVTAGRALLQTFNSSRFSCVWVMLTRENCKLAYVHGHKSI